MNSPLPNPLREALEAVQAPLLTRKAPARPETAFGRLKGAGGGMELGTLGTFGPRATRLKATSRIVSRASNWFTVSSTKPSTRQAATSSDAAAARRFASSVPLSHPKWR